MQQLSSIQDYKSLELELARHRMSGNQFIYRGQSIANWPITSTLYRALKDCNHCWNCWNDYQDDFSRMKSCYTISSILRFKPSSENEDLFVLTMLRHMGFPCHLIDWSASLRSAVIFACSDNKDADGALWILSYSGQISNKPLSISPFEVGSPILICKEFDFIPSNKGLHDLPLGRLRRFRQNGYVSIIPRDYLETSYENLIEANQTLSKVIIPSKNKETLLNELNVTGREIDHLMGFSNYFANP